MVNLHMYYQMETDINVRVLFFYYCFMVASVCVRVKAVLGVSL